MARAGRSSPRARCSPPAPTIRSSTSASDPRDGRRASASRSARAAARAAAGARRRIPRRDRVVAALFAVALAVALAGADRHARRRHDAFENRPWRRGRAAARVATRARGRRHSTPRSPTASAAATRWSRCTTATLLLGFGVSPVANGDARPRRLAATGRGEDGQSLDRHYRGVAPFPPDEPTQIAAEFKRRHDWLAARGIAVRRRGRAGEVHDLSGAPAARGWRRSRRKRGSIACTPRSRPTPRSRCSTCAPALRAAKARERVYYQTDSHWNYNGATSATRRSCAACRRAARAFPAVAAPSARAYVAGRRLLQRRPGRSMLGLPGASAKTTSRRSARSWRDAAGRCASARRRRARPAPRPIRGLRVRPPGLPTRGRLSRLDGDPADPAAVGEFPPRRVS